MILLDAIVRGKFGGVNSCLRLDGGCPIFKN